MKRIIVFDFDGVLVDSNELKQQAFFDLFSASDAKTRSLIKKIIKETPFYFSRFSALKDAFVKLGHSFDFVQNMVDEYEQRYRAEVKKRILAQGVVSGIYEMLNGLRQEGRSLYINSATPNESLRELVNELDLEKYFSRIYGRPPNKADNLRDIMARGNAKASELVMIGDGEEDCVSAKAVNVSFIGIVNKWNGWANAKDFSVAENVFAAVRCLKAIEQES